MEDWEYLFLGGGIAVIVAVLKDMLSGRYDGRNDRPDEPEKLK